MLSSGRARLAVVIIGCLLIAAAVGTYAVLRPHPAQAEAAASLTIFTGSVSVQHRGGSTVAAHTGDTLSNGDNISTGPNTKAAIDFPGGSVTRLDSDSKLTVTSLARTTSGGVSVELSQSAGKTWSKVTQLLGGSGFRVNTPNNGTAEVRGTELSIIVLEDASGAKTVRVDTFSGSVEVTAGGRTVSVPTGQSTTVAGGNTPPAPPAPIPAVDKADSWTVFNTAADVAQGKTVGVATSALNPPPSANSSTAPAAVSGANGSTDIQLTLGWPGSTFRLTARSQGRVVNTITSSQPPIVMSIARAPADLTYSVDDLESAPNEVFWVIVSTSPAKPSPSPSASAIPAPGPTSAATPVPSPSATETPSPSPSPSETPAPTPTATPIPSPSPIASATPTPIATPSPSPSPVPSPSPSPSPSVSPSPSPSPTPTAPPPPPPGPVVSSVSPAVGPAAGGTVVTIGGSNLSGASAVMFGWRAASGVTVVSPNQVQATSPAGTNGPVDITVTTPYGTSATGSGHKFTYADLVVNSPRDLADGPGMCAGAGATCTLRAAVMQASAAAAPVDIFVPAGNYLLTIPPGAIDDGSSGDLHIAGNVHLGGAGSGATLIGWPAASTVDRVIQVMPGASVTIAAVTIQNGYLNPSPPATPTPPAAPAFHGGGILVLGQLTLQDSVVSANTAKLGGGVATYGPSSSATLTNVSVVGNKATSGGGVLEGKGAVTLANSTVSTNVATSIAGGVDEDGGGKVTILNCMITSNQAGYAGGVGAEGSGTVIIRGSTISSNTSNSEGGGVVEDGSDLVIVVDTTISSNTAATEAGGFYAPGAGSVLLDHVTITGNRVTSTAGSIGVLGAGGGFVEDGGDTVSIVNSTISNNTASHAAGIYIDGGGSVSITGSSITGNVATALGNLNSEDGMGGGVLSDGGDSVVISNSTIANNRSSRDGGGILNSAGLMQVIFSTVTGNTAGAGTGGNLVNRIATPSGLQLYGSLVAGGRVGSIANNCGGGAGTQPVISTGYSLEDGPSCQLGATGDLPNTNPSPLGGLAANGGFTQTEMPGAGSPAIDGGGPGCFFTDQRGAARPYGARCDIGAVEYSGGTAPPAAPDPGYAVAVALDGPVAYYRLNENAGIYALTSASRPYLNLTYGTTVTRSQCCALLHDGDPAVKGGGTGYVAKGPGSSPSGSIPTGDAVRSLELLYKAQTPTPAPLENLACLGATASDRFCLSSAAGALQLNGIPFGAPNVADGRWHHIVVTYSGGGLATLYVDGLRAGSTTIPTLNPDAAPQIYLGSDLDGTTAPMTGYLDEVAIYNSVLTGAQVATHNAAR